MILVDASSEVAHEHDLRVGHRLIAAEAAGYRLWLEHQRGPDPLEATDANSECSHGRLTGDPCPAPDGVWPHPHPCACWGERNGRLPSLTPDLIATLKTKEPVVESTTTPPVDAPFGYKADGVTPRKRAAPSAEQLAAASAGRARAAEARKAAQAAPLAIAGTSAVAGTSTTPSIAVVQSPLIARLVAELDAEIAQLNDARNRLLGVE